MVQWLPPLSEYQYSLIYRREQTIEGLTEEREAVFEQPVCHVVEGDSDALERGDTRARVVEVVFNTCPRSAVIAEGLQGGWRDRVDRVTANQLFDVANVAIARILGTGACPQEALGLRAHGCESLPFGGSTEREVALIGELGVGDRDCSEEIRQ